MATSWLKPYKHLYYYVAKQLGPPVDTVPYIFDVNALNGQPKWNLFIGKTAAQANEKETGDPVDPNQEPLMKVRISLWGKKWEEERVKQEGATTKPTRRFVDILVKEEACVRRLDIEKEKKVGRFKLLMEATNKKLKLTEKMAMIEGRKTALEKKRVKIAANAEYAKMLTLNVDSLDADARIILQSVRYQML
ncbi:putative UDP-N-acetylglucosamine--peptide N-acetylglucosaminyltransferase SPINDLY [Hordeum vulgare]|nr:putative UDP-N-acetylglucosamine--peptide N-acetylglucosaminyltransferase SPINDLY [Hordeum vulgare]